MMYEGAENDVNLPPTLPEGKGEMTWNGSCYFDWIGLVFRCLLLSWVSIGHWCLRICCFFRKLNNSSAAHYYLCYYPEVALRLPRGYWCLLLFRKLNNSSAGNLACEHDYRHL